MEEYTNPRGIRNEYRNRRYVRPWGGYKKRISNSNEWLGLYVACAGETWIVIQCLGDVLQLYRPTNRGTEVTKTTTKQNVRVLSDKPGTFVTYKSLRYLVTPNRSVISIESKRILKPDESTIANAVLKIADKQQSDQLPEEPTTASSKDKKKSTTKRK
jgi:hypothetical protein